MSESRCSLESMSPLFRKRREDETGSIAPKGHNSSLTRQIATFINTIDPSRSAVANNMSWKPRAPPRRVLHLAVTMSGVGQMQLVKAHAGIFLDVAAS